MQQGKIYINDEIEKSLNFYAADNGFWWKLNKNSQKDGYFFIEDF